ncbi:MAG: hypothetical protein HZB65_03695 [Candidatus Aenigmarchaeota archaeon]|nr:hypothetical protein [Candidatus Aenigmarchaeota archaeon]
MLAELVIIFGFLGGVVRGFMNLMFAKERKIYLPDAMLSIATDGIVGMVIALLLHSSGILFEPLLSYYLIVMVLAGYVGADIINSARKMLYITIKKAKSKL